MKLWGSIAASLFLALVALSITLVALPERSGLVAVRAHVQDVRLTGDGTDLVVLPYDSTGKIVPFEQKYVKDAPRSGYLAQDSLTVFCPAIGSKCYWEKPALEPYWTVIKWSLIVVIALEVIALMVLSAQFGYYKES